MATANWTQFPATIAWIIFSLELSNLTAFECVAHCYTAPNFNQWALQLKELAKMCHDVSQYDDKRVIKHSSPIEK